MALRPRWRQQPFELLAEANFTGRTTGVNYDLLFPYAVPITATLRITIENLQVYNAAPNDIQDTKIQFQYNGTLYTTPAITILANTRSNLSNLVSYSDIVYRHIGYDLTDFHYTLQEYGAYGTAIEGQTATQHSETVASPGTATLTGIRLTHSNSYVTGQAQIKVYRPKF